MNNLENRYTREIQLGLSRISEVAKKLNLINPENIIINVAGTNGKGSTVGALEAIYHKAGYQVGSYTSPHLIHFNERVKINLKPVSDLNLCNAFNLIEKARGHIHLTYFEFATLAALLCFKEQKLDVVILEVGIGGRLDATNIIDADLSIITGIDFDHQDYLGSTLEAIGFEKAGILRQGKLFIYADDNPPSSIIKVAQDLAVNSFFYGNEFSINEKCDSFEIIFLGQPRCALPKPKIQLKSASAAVVASFLLQNKLPVDPENLAIAMRDLFIPGRLQLIEGPVWTLFDVAHNAQSAKLLANTIKTLNIKGRVHAIFSALKDKDIFGLINPLRDCVDLWYPAQLDNKRALSAGSLLSLFNEAQILAEICYNSPVTAYKTALNQANIGDLIVIYGSFITVSEVIASQQNLLQQKDIL